MIEDDSSSNNGEFDGLIVQNGDDAPVNQNTYIKTTAKEKPEIND